MNYLRKLKDCILNLFKTRIGKTIICLAIGAVVFIACLLIVQLPYWIGEHKVIIRTHFEAADILGFLGDYISAFGALVLGWVAIKQTDKANALSDRVAGLEAARYKEEHNPVILINWVKLHNFDYNDTACKVDFKGKLHYVNSETESNANEERQCIEINFINTGHCGIHGCQLVSVSSQPDELKKDWMPLGLHDSSFNLNPAEELNFNLFVNQNVVEKFAVRQIEKILLVFSCVNDFNEKYNLFFEINGAIHFMGANRHEEQIVPCVHPVNWSFKAERVDSIK